MSPTTRNNRFPLLGAVGVLTVTTLAALLGGLLAVRLAGFAGQAEVALLAAALCLPAAVMALVPVWLGSIHGADGLVRGPLASMILRPVLTLGLVAIAALTSGFRVELLAAWGAGLYLALLIAEVVMIARYLGRIEPGRSGSASEEVTA